MRKFGMFSKFQQNFLLRPNLTDRRIQNDTQDDFLHALYEELFNRIPDKEGFETWKLRLNTGTSIADVLKSFTRSEEFKRNLPKLLAANMAELSLLNSFSQYNEDQIIIESVVADAFNNPYVVDVGAHSIIGSNSFVFSHHLKWPTLLIEANSDLIPELRKNFPLTARICNVAIGTQDNTVSFYVSENSYVSSINYQQTQQWNEKVKKRTVQMMRLADVLSENQVPLDFALLSIDIEGLDLIVIEDLLSQSEYRPVYIVTEINSSPKNEYSKSRLEDGILMEMYEVIAETHVNLILRLREDKLVK